MGNGALAIGPKLPRPSSTLYHTGSRALQASGIRRPICRFVEGSRPLVIFVRKRTVRCTQPLAIVSKICGNQIIRTSASANIELSCGGTYQITVGIERVQKARLIGAGIWLKSPQSIFAYKK